MAFVIVGVAFQYVFNTFQFRGIILPCVFAIKIETCAFWRSCLKKHVFLCPQNPRQVGELSRLWTGFSSISALEPYMLKTCLGKNAFGGVGGLESVREHYTSQLGRVSPNLVTGKTWKVDFLEFGIS